VIPTFRDCLRVPIIALGGINGDNAQEVLDNKADGIAVISAIMASEDPKAAAVRLRRILDSHKPAG
jgi:thiamine-phosphate pyrophosphorylase